MFSAHHLLNRQSAMSSSSPPICWWWCRMHGGWSERKSNNSEWKQITWMCTKNKNEMEIFRLFQQFLKVVIEPTSPCANGMAHRPTSTQQTMKVNKQNGYFVIQHKSFHFEFNKTLKRSEQFNFMERLLFTIYNKFMTQVRINQQLTD